jgi:hypothetical protein
MGRLPCKALICFVFGLFACGETRSLNLEYESLGEPAPDLIMIAKKSPSSDVLSWSTDISGLSGYSEFVASETDFVADLSPCAAGGVDDCNSLGALLGDLFGSGAISLDQPQAALLPDIDLEGDSSLFVFFFYNAFNSEAPPRCFQLRELEVQDEKFRLKATGNFSNYLLIALANPVVGDNCYSFSAGR